MAYGPDDNSRNHVWTSSYLYELPIGKGKRFMSNDNTLVDYLIGGWRLTGNVIWAGGLPWTPSYKDCNSDQDVGVCRPNRASASSRGTSG